MTERKPGLTAQRHDEIGAELHQMHDRLISLSVEVSNAYPFSGPRSRFGKDLDRAAEALTQAKSNGEENFFHDCPDEANITTYYSRKTA